VILEIRTKIIRHFFQSFKSIKIKYILNILKLLFFQTIKNFKNLKRQRDTFVVGSVFIFNECLYWSIILMFILMFILNH